MSDDELIAYTFHWRNGRDETLCGSSAADALNRGGYGRGAVAALDYYEHSYEDNTFFSAELPAALSAGHHGGTEG